MKKRERGEYKGGMRDNNSITKNNTKIDKDSIQYLKYKDIVLDWVANHFNDLTEIYKKYYPKAKDKSVESETSRLLRNVKFIQVKEEVLKAIEIDKEAMAKKALLILDNLSECSEKKSDRIAAALGICKYTIGEKVENTGHMTYTSEEANEYARIRQPLLSLTN